MLSQLSKQRVGARKGGAFPHTGCPIRHHGRKVDMVFKVELRKISVQRQQRQAEAASKMPKHQQAVGSGA